MDNGSEQLEPGRKRGRCEDKAVLDLCRTDCIKRKKTLGEHGRHIGRGSLYRRGMLQGAGFNMRI
jgi:hypothetical protein